MKNKYLILVLFVLGSIFLIKNEAYANDGFGVSYDAKHNLINCIVIENADRFNKDKLFLYFDYSVATGDQLGRPWTQIEKGKCYEYSTDREDTSSVVLIKTDTRDFIDYLDIDAKKQFKNIESIIWGNDNFSDFKSLRERFGESLEISDGIEAYYGQGFRTTGLGASVIVNDLGEINDIQDFKYIFGHGITSFISDQNGEDLLKIYLKENGKEDLSGKLFNTWEDIIKSLTNYSSEISSAYNSCLTNVKRIEHHESVEYIEGEYGLSSNMNSMGTYALLKDGTFLKIKSLRDLLDNDCKEKISNIHKRWTDVINKQGDVYYATVREIKEFQDEDINFSSSKFYADYSLERNSIWSFDYMITLNEKFAASNTSTTSKEYTDREIVQPAKLDSEDISTLQKIDNTFQSVNKNSNYLFYFYIILPIFAVLGILIYVKKRR